MDYTIIIDTNPLFLQQNRIIMKKDYGKIYKADKEY